MIDLILALATAVLLCIATSALHSTSVLPIAVPAIGFVIMAGLARNEPKE